MRAFRQSRLARFVASLVLGALAAGVAPQATAASAREVRLGSVLDHPAAVRAALAAADAAATPEAAVGAFVEAYRLHSGADLPAEAVASAVADLLLGRAMRPVPPPEARIAAAPQGPTNVTPSPIAAVAVTGDGASLPVSSGAVDGPMDAISSTDGRILPPTRAP